MLTDSAYLSVVHYYYHVSFHYRCDTLSNDYLCGFRDVFCKAAAYKSIGLCVYRACGVVKNKYFWFLEKCACNAKALFLTARYICTALLNVGVVSFGKALNKVVRLCELACVDKVFVGCVFVTPAQILCNSAGE